MKTSLYYLTSLLLLMVMSCKEPGEINTLDTQPVYQDIPFWQDYSIKYYVEEEDPELSRAYCDRNGEIKILSSEGLLRIHAGVFLYPGTFVADRSYRPVAEKNIAGLGLYRNQFAFVDDEAVVSDAWAGKVFLKHSLPKACLFAGGAEFDFLISDGRTLQYLDKSKAVWEGSLPADQVIDILFDATQGDFWILGNRSLALYSPGDQELRTVFNRSHLTCMDLVEDNEKIFLGTSDGYIEIDALSYGQIGDIHRDLPWTEITAVRELDGKIWVGTTRGAFMIREDGKFNYYYGERWLPGNEVKHISAGDEGSVLILTDQGLGKICFREMTLHDKAVFYEKQVRQRHIRNGFNAGLVEMEKGKVNTGRLRDSDNDGLWTSMYLAGQVFRYSVTGEEEALQNCRESMDAMERLYTINPVPGFPSRSFERSGFIERLSDPDRWQHTDDPEWDWKATTSSDEAIGHIFAFGVMAELIDDAELKNKAIKLIDDLMWHIVDHDMYLVDYDGKPTTWGKWNPDYVNARPKMVGDRKINSSNIIAMLQTAYHFAGKEIYKEKAFELMTEHGYFENLMRPMSEIGPAPEDADDWSKMLSASWNHSDDEMYFVGYWGLYHYAFNDTLKSRYKEAIIDHWETERPEKEAAWNLITAITGTPEFDLPESVWWLREYPLDLIDWVIMNSHRKDIEFMEPNFRRQTITEVLPPDEVPVHRHNGNMFSLDRGSGNGLSEHSAGDIWLLPYWTGRYLGVITAPVND